MPSIMQLLRCIFLVFIGAGVIWQLTAAEYATTVAVNDFFSPQQTSDQQLPANAVEGLNRATDLDHQHVAKIAETLTQQENASETGHSEALDLQFTYLSQRSDTQVVGRFYSNDPVGFTPAKPMMFNRYAYANNNPYKYTDPDGRNPFAGAAAGCAISGPACPAGAVVGAVIGATLGVVGVVVYNEMPDNGPATPDPETGKEPDPADKGGELTKSGRAGQKHGSREGSAFPPATGNADSKNNQGQAILEDIVKNPDSTSEGNQRGGTDVYAPDGKGARFDKNGKFTGFLEPKIEK